ncbi:MAG TPA: hypothetical protein VGF17_07710, partial [Phytomonospora sp.]
TRLSIVVPAAFCLIVVLGIGVFLLTSPPQASCAKVVVEPGASAAVWKELGEAPLRYKRHVDQVKLYEAKDLVTVDGIVYQPVHVREGGWALMRRDELEDVKCSVQ